MESVENYTFFISPYTRLVNKTFRKKFFSFPPLIPIGNFLHDVELEKETIPKKNTFIFRHLLKNNNIFLYNKYIESFNKVFNNKETLNNIVIQGSPVSINEENCNNYIYGIFQLNDAEQYLSKKIDEYGSFHISTMMQFSAGNILFVNNEETFKNFLKTIKFFKKFS